MDCYRKNIFIFWDKNLPLIYASYVQYLRVRFSDYNIHLIDDAFMNKFYEARNDPFGATYSRLTIGAAKSDIARLALLYEYGGLYLDIMTCPQDGLDMDALFEKLDHKSAYFPCWETPSRSEVGLPVILSKPKQPLLLELRKRVEKNFVEQCAAETLCPHRSPYNICTLSGAIVFHDIVVDRPFVTWTTYLTCREKCASNAPYLEPWDCDLFPVLNFFQLNRIGYNNHHGTNMHLHWSEVQKKQPLFSP